MGTARVNRLRDRCTEETLPALMRAAYNGTPRELNTPFPTGQVLHTLLPQYFRR